MAVSKLTIRRIIKQKEIYKSIPVFVAGNKKLGGVLIFNLPPLKTCSGATAFCIKYCYAMKGQHTFPNVLKSNETRYQMSLKTDFIEKACTELVKKKNDKYEHVRIHASGDFYSTEYINKWIEIAKKNPKKIFLAYTRQQKYTPALKKLSKLKNVSLFESLDPSRPVGILGFKTAIISDTLANDTFSCPGNNCGKCGYVCWNTGNKQNIRFKLH